MKKLLYLVCFINSGIYGMEYNQQEIQKNLDIIFKYDSLPTDMHTIPTDMHTIIKKYIPQQLWYEKKCFQHEGMVMSSYLDERETKLITQTSKKVYIWDIKKNDSLIIENNRKTSMLLNKEITKIFFSTKDSFIEIYDIINKELLLKIPHQYQNFDNIRLAQFNTDETLLMTITNEQIISLWNIQLNEISEELPYTGIIKYKFFHDRPIKLAFLNKDETKLIVCSGDTATIWDIQTQKKIFNGCHKNDFVSTALLYNNEQQLITIISRGLLYKWNIKKGKKVEKIETILNVDNAFFNTDQTKLIMWSDTTIVIHDVVTSKEIKKFIIPRFKSAIRDVCLNEVGFLAIAFDNKIKLLNSASGDCVAVIQHNNKTYNNWITSLCFNKNGTQLITSSFDKTTKIWKQYDYTIDQIVLYNLLCTWILLEKPDKNIKNINNLLNKIASLLLQKEQDMHIIWLTFPQKVQKTIWNQMERIIQQYGKYFLS